MQFVSKNSGEVNELYLSGWCKIEYGLFINQIYHFRNENNKQNP